jgi:hypothetical protein
MPVGEQPIVAPRWPFRLTAAAFTASTLGVGQVLARRRFRLAAGVTGGGATASLTVGGVTSAKCGFGIDFCAFCGPPSHKRLLLGQTARA